MQTHQGRLHHRGATRLKCIILGSANAGKTCLLRRYVHGTFEDDIEMSKDATKGIVRSTNSTLGADYYVKKTDSGSVFLQLWDTAGKERLKPQKIPNQYDKKSNYYQFLSISVKDSNTKNTTHYEHRYNNWGNGVVKDVKEFNSGECGRPFRDQQFMNSSDGSKSLGDALFRNVHVCMLVYDATSSTSFLHLMQWHSEWIQKMKQWEKEDNEYENRRNGSAAFEKRRKEVPFIVVASKADLLHKEIESPLCRRYKCRSVMGFKDDYKGIESVYEYAVEDSSDESEARARHSKLQEGKRDKKLTYSLKETTWLNDASYLKSLQIAEDQLPANRLMILLWCKRNNIPHVEASALTGEGVNNAFQMLVKNGLEELEAREREKAEQERRRKIEQEKRNKLEQERTYFVYQPKYEQNLDLFSRYSSKEEKRCSFLSCLLSFFTSCLRFQF